jgi:4-carboxymuconolactone decarboxylase
MNDGLTDLQRHEQGMDLRRAVLGEAHVNSATASTTEFTAPFQDFITRTAWGDIWARPGLDRRSRSMITLTALVALGQTQEIAIHVRGALNNGLTRQEVSEIFLHAAIYVGVPAANSAFTVAQQALADIDAED